MNTDNISVVYASGKEIEAIIKELSPILGKYPRGHQIMACVGSALIMQNPDTTFDELMKNVMATTQYMALLVTSPNEPIPLKNLN